MWRSSSRPPTGGPSSAAGGPGTSAPGCAKAGSRTSTLTEVDLGDAVRAALAVWYFPGMWEWGRAIVRPLALEAYRGVVAAWPAGYEAVATQGEKLLGRYFDWAPAVDLFTPIRVATDLEVRVPDPSDPRRDLAATDGVAVHYADRVDLVVVDPFNTYWLVDHRIGDELGRARRPRARRGRRRRLLGVGPFVPRHGHRRRHLQRAAHRRRRFRRGVPADAGPARPGRARAGPPQARLRGAGHDDAPAWPCTRRRHGTCARAACTGRRASPSTPAPTPRPCSRPGYRRRPPVVVQEGRLGGATWSMGRGAAPPKFGPGPHPGR